MLEQFFQFGTLPANHMTGIYDLRLVILSYLVAVFASYIALDITGRLRDISNTQLSMMLWICGGALAMGAGIWSMHFIGMLAFSMAMPISYNPLWTILSMAVAVGASAFALILLKARVVNLPRMIFGGIVLGIAIASMHYTGMAAMNNAMDIRYLPGLFFLSIVIAIFASEAALYLAIKSTEVLPKIRERLKFISAFIMGAAICGMHYTGMMAAVFTPRLGIPLVEKAGLNPELMAISIAGVTTIILGIAFAVSAYKESINQQLLLTARQAGMAEVAASVLHNIGNVLNSINVSSAVITEKINHSKLAILIDLQRLLEENKHNLPQFLTEDSRGKQVPDLIIMLTTYWKTEKDSLLLEAQTLMNNVQYIKNIIATQQDLSRVSSAEQIVSIENVLEESLLISGIDNAKYSIQLQKSFKKLRPVLIDKVKLLQIIVNLIQNAKDAVLATDKDEKIITFNIQSNGPFLYIKIADNGLGIPHENLTKIFTYGFTTKKAGHGFGLHTSAVSAKEMGGSLHAESAGLGKGAEFILKLPYHQYHFSNEVPVPPRISEPFL